MTLLLGLTLDANWSLIPDDLGGFHTAPVHPFLHDEYLENTLFPNEGG